MSRFNELQGGGEESFGPGIDLVFSICAILFIVLTMVYQLYQLSKEAAAYYQTKNERLEIEKANQQLEIDLLLRKIGMLSATKEQPNKHELRVLFAEVITRAARELTKLKRELESKDFPISIEQRPDGLFFDMGVFFKVNEYDKRDIRNDQLQNIYRVGEAFRNILDKSINFENKREILRNHMRIVIEGHTDDKKPPGDHFVNFHYSKERAYTVLKLLIERNGLMPPKYKISLAGFAEFGRAPKLDADALLDNDIRKSKMRRVTISIVPDYDLLMRIQAELESN